MKPWLVGLVCFVVGHMVVPLIAFGYLDYGRPPVAVTAPSFPFERQIVRSPLHRRIDSEMAQPPTKATDQSLLAGAITYKQKCAFCHGLPEGKAEIGKNMFRLRHSFGQSTVTVSLA